MADHSPQKLPPRELSAVAKHVNRMRGARCEKPGDHAKTRPVTAGEADQKSFTPRRRTEDVAFSKVNPSHLSFLANKQGTRPEQLRRFIKDPSRPSKPSRLPYPKSSSPNHHTPEHRRRMSPIRRPSNTLPRSADSHPSAYMGTGSGPYGRKYRHRRGSSDSKSLSPPSHAVVLHGAADADSIPATPTTLVEVNSSDGLSLGPFRTFGSHTESEATKIATDGSDGEDINPKPAATMGSRQHGTIDALSSRSSNPRTKSRDGSLRCKAPGIPGTASVLLPPSAQRVTKRSGSTRGSSRRYGLIFSQSSTRSNSSRRSFQGFDKARKSRSNGSHGAATFMSSQASEGAISIEEWFSTLIGHHDLETGRNRTSGIQGDQSSTGSGTPRDDDSDAAPGVTPQTMVTLEPTICECPKEDSRPHSQYSAAYHRHSGCPTNPANEDSSSMAARDDGQDHFCNSNRCSTGQDYSATMGSLTRSSYLSSTIRTSFPPSTCPTSVARCSVAVSTSMRDRSPEPESRQERPFCDQRFKYPSRLGTAAGPLGNIASWDSDEEPTTTSGTRHEALEKLSSSQKLSSSHRTSVSSEQILLDGTFDMIIPSLRMVNPHLRVDVSIEDAASHGASGSPNPSAGGPVEHGPLTLATIEDFEAVRKRHRLLPAEQHPVYKTVISPGPLSTDPSDLPMKYVTLPKHMQKISNKKGFRKTAEKIGSALRNLVKGGDIPEPPLQVPISSFATSMRRSEGHDTPRFSLADAGRLGSWRKRSKWHTKA